MSKKKRKGGRYTPPMDDHAKLVRQRLRQARAQHSAATIAAQRDPENHELRVKAFALAGAVKTIEGLLD